MIIISFLGSRFKHLSKKRMHSRSPPQRAPKGAALWTPAPRRGGVLRGPRQRDSSLWTPLHRLRAGRELPTTPLQPETGPPDMDGPAPVRRKREAFDRNMFQKICRNWAYNSCCREPFISSAQLFCQGSEAGFCVIDCDNICAGVHKEQGG